MPSSRLADSSNSSVFKQIVALALLNVSMGWLGLQLAIPPGYVTAVFPPAGIALAAMLKCGPRVWPGVFLGSIGLNVVVAATSPAGFSPDGLGLAAIIAAGSTLQAWAGCWLIERRLPDAKQLRDGRKLVLMLLAGGPLACLIASATGSLALVALGKNSWNNWPFSMWSWWIGDTIGVILCTPTFLVLSQLTWTNWRRQTATIVLPSLTMLALVVQLFFQSNTWEQERIKAAFHAQARTIEDDMRRDVDRYQDAVYAVRQLFKATGDVSPEAFRQFSHDLVVKYPGILALEYVDQVEASQREVYEQRISSSMPGFKVQEFSASGTLVSVSNRDLYYPIRYIDPLPPYKWLLGFDMGSEPRRRDAFIQARDSRKTTATAAIILLSSTQKGLLVLEPIYRPLAAPDKAENGFNGMAMAVFQVETMIGQAMPDSIGKDMVVHVEDITDAGHTDLLYASSGSPAKLYPELNATVPLAFANRHWQVRMQAGDAFVLRQTSYVSWLVLAGGLLFTGILQMLLLSLSSHARNIEDEVERRTRQLADSEQRLSSALEEKETLLKEVYHRVKNNLQVITSLLSLEKGGMVAGPAREALDNTGDRVRAMALVHEKLYQSGNLASVALNEYVKDLVDQLLYSGAAGSPDITVQMDIVDVQIGLDSAIPLGLLLNELVSNSTKHAFPDGKRGVLKIVISGTGPNLHLLVTDDGVGLPPEFDIARSPSMGLKLAVSLARQLGGKLTIQSDSSGVAFSTDVNVA